MDRKVKTLEFLVEGGAATPGPPIGPALGPMGLNVPAVVRAINEATKEFQGMRVPVKVHVDLETRGFEIEVGIPTTAALLLKEAGVEKGSKASGVEFVGDLSMKQIVKIAGIVRAKSMAKTFKGTVKEVLGSCISIGLRVEGKHPREVIREVDEGVYDDLIKEAEESRT